MFVKTKLFPKAGLLSALIWLGILSSAGLLGSCTPSLRRQEARATNRTHLRVVEADTVQQFDVTVRRKKHLRRNRYYYWYAQDQVHRAEGEYNGRLLHGPYRATARAGGQTLRRGKFHYGTKTGRWLTWHPNGQLASMSRWHHGQRRGKPIFYDSQGDKLKGQPASAAPHAPRSWWRGMLRRQARKTTPVTGGTLPPVTPSASEAAKPVALPAALEAAPLSEIEKKQRKAAEKDAGKQQRAAEKAAERERKVERKPAPAEKQKKAKPSKAPGKSKQAATTPAAPTP